MIALRPNGGKRPVTDVTLRYREQTDRHVQLNGAHRRPGVLPLVLAVVCSVLFAGTPVSQSSDPLAMSESNADIDRMPRKGSAGIDVGRGEHAGETTIFANAKVRKDVSSTQNQNPTNVRSAISIFDLENRTTQVVYTANRLWEAPNWSSDGKYLVANSGGMLYKLALDGRTTAPEQLRLDPAYRSNNDHGISPDGKILAFSATTDSSHGSQVFFAPLEGLNPRLVVSTVPSYFHGWSPDGQRLAFVGQREGHFSIFRVSTNGGSEERLTSRPVNDDGPDYSPDGKWIYINSNRSGSWKIWRIPAGGAGPDDSQAQQITSDDQWEDWFPHPSPDGRWLVFLSFPKGTPGHDVKTQVALRMIPLPSNGTAGRKSEAIQVLTSFFGGQGTINVNSWSPDSKRFAFVSYTLLP